MDLINSAWDVWTSALVFVVGLFLAKYFGAKFNLSFSRSLALYIWHTIFTFLYAFYVIKYGGDSIYYYNESLRPSQEFVLGTRAVIYFTSIFSTFFDLSFLGVFLVFNIIGLIGLIVYDSIFLNIASDKSKLVQKVASVIIFLPSISFWTVAIGKDAPAFSAAALMLWSSFNWKSNPKTLLLSLVIMFLIRPHIAAILLFCITISVVIGSGIAVSRRIFYVTILIVSLLIFLPVIFENLGINGLQSYENYVDDRQNYNRGGTSSIDISNMSVPMQMFSYLLRPLPSDFSGFSSVAASVDNLILLIFFVIFGFMIVIRKNSFKRMLDFVFPISFSIISLLLLSSTTANLGIAIRQKWMFVPMMIFVFFALTKKKYKTNAKKNINLYYSH